MIGELVGRAQRDETTSVKDGDLVNAGDGCGAVCDDQDRLSLNEAGEGFLNIGLGFRVGKGRCLVENEDGCIDEEGARNRDALRLATGGVSVLPDDGVEASGQGAQVVVDARGPGGRPYLFVAGARDSERDVVAHGDVEELRVLEDEGDVSVENVGGNVASIDPADADSPPLRVGEARDQRRERRFSRAGGTHEGGHRSLGDRQAHVIQREGLSVGERDAINLDVSSLRLCTSLGGQRIHGEQVNDSQRCGPGDLVGPCRCPQNLDGRRDDEGDERAGDDLDRTDDPRGRERGTPRRRDEQDQGGGHGRLPERGAFQQRAAPVDVEA